MADFTKINSSTQIREFPDIYNGNIDNLINEIERLKGLISDKDNRIAALESKYDSYARNLKAYLDNILVSKFNEFEERIEKCENSVDNFDSRIKTLERNNNQ